MGQKQIEYSHVKQRTIPTKRKEKEEETHQMSKYRWTSKVSDAQYHKETDTYTYTEETTDPVRRDILSEKAGTIWMNRKAIELLDSQGRHRSQWAYAPYDGRSWNGTTANRSNNKK